MPTTRVSPRCGGRSPSKLEREQGLKYDPDREILITDGATLGVCAALGALLNPDRRLLLPDPIYDAYAAPIALWGGSPVPVPATLRDGRFAVDRQIVRAVVVLDDDAAHLAQHALESGRNRADPGRARGCHGVCPENHDCPVISDEIYESLVYDGHRHVSPASVSADARARTVVINSLSKTYAMTGWRVGYCAGPEEIIKAMLLVLQQSSRGPATFVQDAAACALTSDQDCVRRMAAGIPGPSRSGGRTLAGYPGVEPLVPEGGLFVMVDVRGLKKSSEDVRGSCFVMRGSS